MRSFISKNHGNRLARFLIVAASLFVAGLLDAGASIPKTRVWDFFDRAPVLTAPESLQVAELHLENRSLYDWNASGSTLWTHFDPEGLANEEFTKEHSAAAAVFAGIHGVANALSGGLFNDSGTPLYRSENQTASNQALAKLSRLSSASFNPANAVATDDGNGHLSPNWEGLGNLAGGFLVGKGFANLAGKSSSLKAMTSAGSESAAATSLKSAVNVENQVSMTLEIGEVSTGKGSLNPNTRAASLKGTALHSDRPGNLPEQLRSMYPETGFDFKPSGAPGQDVRVTDGIHPSFYPYGNWQKGIDFGDFKPDTVGGRRTFNSDQRTKWTQPTQMLLYRPETGKLTE